MLASTLARIVFSAYVPAPAMPTPVLLVPPPMPTATAITTASIVCDPVASTRTRPAELIDESLVNVCTSTGTPTRFN